MSRRRRVGRASIVFVLLLWAAIVPATAEGATNCGTSGTHTICVTVPDGPLSGERTITITNSPNTGKVISRWIPSTGAASTLVYAFKPYPSTNNYSFVWPTQKYLDASGILRVYSGSTSSAPVEVALTLGNGNVGDFQHSPNDWASFLPVAWDGSNDPVVVAVGDGPSGEPTANSVAARIEAIGPPLFLFLGDVYETGTFAENRNHYGISSMDVPNRGTLWGATADVTQPTLGNHEAANKTAWIDYWHGRPLFSRFTFGGVLFLDIDSNGSMTTTSKQYQMVHDAITDASAPSCIVAFWHTPPISGDVIKDKQRAMWSLLADGGGDLLLVGHNHSMAEYVPMDAGFVAGTPNAHMVELLSGAGGHGLGGGVSGARVAWVKGKTAGLLALTLNGAAGGASASSIGWTFQDVNGAGLRSGSVDCA